MIEQVPFFEKFNINELAFKATGLKWEELEEIYNDYLAFKDELEPTAIMLFNKLMKSGKVHSVRFRIKEPEHLIEKIIRKKCDNNKSNITIKNYKEEVTDLIGLRALHLFKEDWETINDFITSTWKLKEKHIAYYRNGDSKESIDLYKQKGCKCKEHKYGYRSVHYVIKTQPAKLTHFGEIQVRTIYEEAWAEIDHTIRYPYDLDNPIFYQFLLILNRLSGSADEMGSFIQFLKGELEIKQAAISELETQIEKLKLKDQLKEEIKLNFDKIKNQNILTTNGTAMNEYYRKNNAILSMMGMHPALLSAAQNVGNTISQLEKDKKLLSDKSNQNAQ